MLRSMKEKKNLFFLLTCFKARKQSFLKFKNLNLNNSE